MGTVIESATEFYTGRLTKKNRKATLADELLSDTDLAQYRYERKDQIFWSLHIRLLHLFCFSLVNVYIHGH